MQISINGSVQPGFESIKNQFAKNLSASRDRNAQLCIYVGEECVVDLWASAIGDESFTGDSLVNVFSSGKSLESILLGMLVDREGLAFDTLVQRVWPAFEGQGKDALTLADVMRHEAGLAVLNVNFSPTDIQPPAIHNNVVGKVLEDHPLKFPDDTSSPREYHALSRGWIANEIFRRIDSGNRTMGEFLREHVSGPLGIDVHIGLKDGELDRVSPVKERALAAQLLDGLTPGTFARRVGLTYLEMLRRFWHLRNAIGSLRATRNTLPIQGMAEHGVKIFDSEGISKSEIPSAGAKCNARGLAKLAAVMANGGEFGGQALMSNDAWQKIHANPINRKMTLLHSAFTQGGLAQFEDNGAAPKSFAAALNAGREGFFGWMGYGGSVFQWHPELRIGFAYVPTALYTLDFFNQRGKTYQQQTVACVRSLSS